MARSFGRAAVSCIITIMNYVLTFESTHKAMAAQAVFSADGRRFALIPTPREISAGCGMSLKFKADSEMMAREWLDLLISETGDCESATLHAL